MVSLDWRVVVLSCVSEELVLIWLWSCDNKTVLYWLQLQGLQILFIEASRTAKQKHCPSNKW